MPKFRITSPDGQEYEVTTPDGVEPSHEELVKAVSGQHAAPEDPYANMSLDQIKAQYRGAQLTNAGPEVLSKLADAYVSKEQSERSKAGGITGLANAADNFVRDFARGVPVIGGGLDEASAYLNTLGGGNYQENLDYQRARDRFNEKQFGGLSTATQIGGGIAGTIGGLRSLGVGGVAAPAQSARMLPTVTQALASGATGVGVGAADGFLRGEGDTRGQGAAIGGALGGVLGTATPYVAGAVGAGTRRVLDYLTSDAALQRLGISREAANVLIRQLSTDDTLTQAGAQRIRESGPQAMLADAGPSATNLLDTALQRSGPGSTAARQAIEQRATQANQGLRQSLDQTFGTPPVGVETRQAAIRQGTAGARANAYDAAYDQPIDFNTPHGQQLAQDIQRLQNSAQWAIDEAQNEIAMRGEQPTLVRILDRATRALNSAAQRGERGGAMRGQTPLGDAAGQLAADIRNSLRQAVPEYGRALDTAADPIRRIQATEFGASILDSNVSRERVAQELAGMTGPERLAAMNGIRDAIDEVAANVKQAVSNPNLDASQLRETLKALSSNAVRQKIEAVVGQNAARSFFGQVGRFQRALELRASVAVNSRTFGREATDKQVKAAIDSSILDAARSGRPIEAARRAFQRMTNMTPLQRLEAEDRLYGEIANALTTVRGTAAETHLNRLRAAIQARSTNYAGARAVGATAGRGIAGTGAAGIVRVQRPSQD